MKKNKKLNNKGFTLIEVLAVIVILLIIVGIAIPNISASLDRQTCKTTENKAKLIESAAQFYVSDNRNKVNDNLDADRKCKIEIEVLEGKTFDITDNIWKNDPDKEKYINSDDLKDGNNQPFDGYVIYDKLNETYTFCFNNDSCNLNPKDNGGIELCDASIQDCIE